MRDRCNWNSLSRPLVIGNETIRDSGGLLTLFIHGNLISFQDSGEYGLTYYTGALWAALAAGFFVNWLKDFTFDFYTYLSDLIGIKLNSSYNNRSTGKLLLDHTKGKILATLVAISFFLAAAPKLWNGFPVEPFQAF